MLGDDWIHNFVKRNKLSKQALSNIKCCGAMVDEDTINS